MKILKPTNEEIKAWFIQMISRCDGLAITRWNSVESFLDECGDFADLRSLFGQEAEGTEDEPEQ